MPFTCSEFATQIQIQILTLGVMLWNATASCSNTSHLKVNGAMDVAWMQNELWVAAKSTVECWDSTTATRKSSKRCSQVANAIAVCRSAAASANDDGSIYVYNDRSSSPIHTLVDSMNLPQTAVCFSSNGDFIFSAGIANSISVWDLASNSIAYLLEGHYDTVTGLALSPNGNFLLSNAMDNSVRVWDVRPFAVGATREYRVLDGKSYFLSQIWV